MLSLILFCAYMLDRLLGEPRHWHPLVGFGRMADYLEKRLNPQSEQLKPKQIIIGSLALCLLITAVTLVVIAILSLLSETMALLFSLFGLYLCLGNQSLREHVTTIKLHLLNDDLASARQAVAMIVSRDTHAMDQQACIKATLESNLENANDAVFATIFWFTVAGLPGAVVYRLVNTLDAIWGYRTQRFNLFGRAAARLDDLLNLIPARLTALSFCFLGNSSQAWQAWRQQAASWKSPNAGVVMASGAGALKIQLGGAADYHGKQQQRSVLGCCRSDLEISDIDHSLKLIRFSLWLWLALIAFIQISIWIFTHA